MSTKADNMILNTLFSAKSLFRKTRTDRIQEQLTDLQKAMSDLNAKMNHLVTENEKVKSLIRESLVTSKLDIHHYQRIMTTCSE